MLSAEVTTWVKILQAHGYMNWCWEVGEEAGIKLGLFWRLSQRKIEDLKDRSQRHNSEYWHSAWPL